MAIDCLREPGVIAFAKTFGASIGILGAALAWLLNNALRWLVWLISERRREYELIKGLSAEIASNAASEKNWSSPEVCKELIAKLSVDPGPRKPWAPYVAVVDANFVFDNIKDAINRLPAEVIAALVEYYNLTNGLTTQLADFRSEAYLKLSHDRQVKLIQQVYTLGAVVANASARAQAALAQRLRMLKVTYGLTMAVFTIAAAKIVPAAISASATFAEQSLTPAVEWASTCDLTPKVSK
jgi:hypothetical protein